MTRCESTGSAWHARIVAVSVLALLVISLVHVNASEARKSTKAKSADSRVIEGDVKVAGIEVGGSSIAAASSLLDRRLSDTVNHHIFVFVGRRKFGLSAKRAKARLDTLRTAKRAYYAGRDATSSKAVEADEGGVVQKSISVPPAIDYSPAAVKKFAQNVARRVSRRSRDATTKILITKIRVRRARTGLSVDASQITDALTARIKDPTIKRRVRVKARKVLPAVTNGEVKNKYGTVLTIDRKNYKLRLFKKLKLKRTYRIALGQAGFDTPSGLFTIGNKSTCPVWTAPNKPWAGSLAGKTIPCGDPRNPLLARWLGVAGADGVGIHGTGSGGSIGSSASHGCIRMLPSQVKKLYPLVPVGTPIRISR